MYANFFGLHCLPFEDRADTKFYFGTSSSEETLAALEYECRHGKDMILVLGEAGVGKTMLIRMLALRLPVGDRVVVLTARPNGELNVIRETCKAFGVNLPSSLTSGRCLARLRRHLKRTGEGGHRSIAIIDRAENLCGKDLNDLAALADLENDQARHLCIILAGQPRLRPLLDRPKYVGLRRRLVGERILTGLANEETEKYIEHRLRVAGAGDPDLFDKDAVAVIFRAAKGLPGLINRFCDVAMVAAYGAGEKRIAHNTAVESTRTSTVQERSADIRDVGITTKEQTSTGFPGGPSPYASPWPQHTPSQSVSPPPPESSYGTTDAGSPVGRFGPILEKAIAGDPVDTLDRGSADGEAVVYTAGTAVLDRLESTIAEAERISATSQATLVQQAAVEKHLGSLTPRAERLIEGLNQTVQHAAASLEGMQTQFERLTRGAQRSVAAVETQVTCAADVAQSTGEQTQRVEDACELAERLESRLASFAEQLADRANTVQERVTRLMTGVESGEEVSRNLDSVVERASTIAAEAKATVDTLQANVREESETLGRGLRTHQRATSEAEARVDTLIARLTEKVDHTLHQVEHASADALADHRQQLQKQVDIHRDSLQQMCKSVQERLLAASESAESKVAGAASALEDCDDKLKAKIDLAQRTTQEHATDAHARFQEDLQKVCKNAQEQLLRASESAESKVAGAASALEDYDHKLKAKIDLAQRTTQEHATDAHARFQEDLKKVCENVQERLLRASENADSKVADATTALKGYDDKLKAKIDVAERMMQKHAADAHARVQEDLQVQLDERQQALQDACRSAREQVGQVREEASSTLADLKGAFEADTAALSAKLKEMLEESTANHRLLETAVATGREKVKGFMADLETLESRRRNLEDTTDKLSEKLQGAGGRANDLTETVEVAGRTVDALGVRADQARAKLSHVVERGEVFVSDVQASHGQIETLQRSVAAALVEIGAACERVNAMRGQVPQCEQTAARLSVAHEIGEDTIERLNSAVASGTQTSEAVTELCAQADGKIERFRTLNASAVDLVNRLDKAERSAREVARQADKSAQAVGGVARDAKEQAGRLESLQKAGGGTVHRLEELTESCTQLKEAIEAFSADAEEQIGQLDTRTGDMAATLRELADATANTIGATEKANAATDAANRAAELAGLKTTEAKAQVGQLTSVQQTSSEAAGQLSELITSALRLQGTLDVLNADVNTRIDQLNTHKADAIRTLGELAQTAADSEDTIAKVNVAAEAAGRAADEAGKAAEVADKTIASAREQNAELSTTQQITVRTTGQLDELIASSTRLLGTLGALATEVDEKIDLLDSSSTEAIHMANKLSEVNDTGLSVVARVQQAKAAAETAADEADRSAVEAEERAVNLASAREGCEKATTQLDEALASATQLRGALKVLTQDATGVIGQVDSHNAAARQVLHELSDANKNAHDLIGQAHEATQSGKQAADHAKQRIDILLKDVWDLTTKTEVNAERLTECNTRAADLVGHLRASSQPAAETAKGLQELMTQAEPYLADLSEGCRGAKALAERLPAITRAVKAAKDLDATIGRTVGQAEDTYGKLSAADQSAEQTCAELTGVNSAALELIEKEERLNLAAQEISGELSDQLEVTSGSIEAGEQLVREFVAQSRRLQGELDTLHGKTAGIEKSLSRFTAEPKQIIATAQAQAAQLERVCGTVRKVFAGLARTTLEAKQQVEELRGTSGQASERLTRLTTETDRASSTLREWVGEAIRVQARLDTSLRHCPSISETHPGDSLDAVTRVAQPLPRIANRSAVRDKDATPETEATAEPRPERALTEENPPTPRRSVEEINQLIRQAKSAATRAGTR